MLRRIILLASAALAPIASASCISSRPLLGRDQGVARRAEPLRDERCDTVTSYRDFAQWSERRYEEERSMARAGNRTIIEPRENIVIDTWFHVISKSKNPAEGYISVNNFILFFHRGFSSGGPETDMIPPATTA